VGAFCRRAVPRQKWPPWGGQQAGVSLRSVGAFCRRAVPRQKWPPWGAASRRKPAQRGGYFGAPCFFLAHFPGGAAIKAGQPGARAELLVPRLPGRRLRTHRGLPQVGMIVAFDRTRPAIVSGTLLVFSLVDMSLIVQHTNKSLSVLMTICADWYQRCKTTPQQDGGPA